MKEKKTLNIFLAIPLGLLKFILLFPVLAFTVISVFFALLSLIGGSPEGFDKICSFNERILGWLMGRAS